MSSKKKKKSKNKNNNKISTKNSNTVNTTNQENNKIIVNEDKELNQENNLNNLNSENNIEKEKKEQNNNIHSTENTQIVNLDSNKTVNEIESTIKNTKPIDNSNIKTQNQSKAIQEINNESLNTTKHDSEKTQFIKKKKNKTLIAIIVFLILIVLLSFSTIFAFLNLNNNTIAKGVLIQNLDVSNLSFEQAKEILYNKIKNQLILDIGLNYKNELQFEFNPEQIEYNFDIDNALTEAYNIGKIGNIFENNYNLLLTAFSNKIININSSYNEELLNNIIDDVSSKIPGVVIEPSYYIENNELIINNGKPGILVDKEKLKEIIIQNINNRNLDNTEKQTIEIPVIESEPDPINIEQIYAEIYTEPKDAYYETEPFKIYAEVNGIDLDMSLDQAKEIIDSEKKDEYKFSLKITPANKTINDIGTEAFPYLISSFSTKYDASNINRSNNLAIAAKKINGTVLMPGESFSFNKIVGKRTVEEGYRDAKIYQNGSVVDGLAGGICQISSTLYNAVLLANLEIEERSNHSFTTSYLPAGRDATVVYGVRDLKFKNTRTYPIKIEANVSGGIAEFKIHGIAEETEYEIKIIPVTTQSIPYGTETIIDPSLAPGQRIVTQAGHAGYKVTTYKELHLNGSLVSKEIISNDTYQPMKAIVRVGP